MMRAFAWLLSFLMVFVVAKNARAAGTQSEVCGVVPGATPIVSTAETPSGTTVGHANDIAAISAACNNRFAQVAGADVVYAVDVKVNNAFSIKVTPSAGYDVSIYLLGSGCDTNACTGLAADDGGPGVAETITANGLAIGTYYLVIDSFYTTTDARSSGTYTIAMTGSLGGQPTTTTLADSPTPSSFLTEPVTFTATAAAGATPANAGKITFNIDTVDVSTVDVDAQGKATLTTSLLPVGPHTIVAKYLGGGQFLASTSSPITHTVGLAPTTTDITPSPATGTFGSATTFSVAVTSTFGTPVGSVELFDGTTSLGTKALTGGNASFSISTLGGGTHTINAQFTATSPYSSSNDSISYVVNPANGTLTLTSSTGGADVFFGTSITFTATVATLNATPPTGTVSFKLEDNTSLGSGLIDAAGSIAITTASIPVGNHTITASYSGNVNYAPASQGIAQKILIIPTTTAVLASPEPSSAGAAFTLTATITPTTGAKPTGTVTFSIDGTSQAPVTLDNGVATLSTGAALAPGIHAIVATYNGSATNSGSSGTTNHTVSKIPVTVALTADPDTSVYLQPISLVAKLTPNTTAFGIPGGTVEFFDDTTSLGTATLDATATATLPTALPVGAHPKVKAVYVGDAVYATGTSSEIKVTVNKADTKTSLVSSSNPSVASQPITFTAHVDVVAPGGGIPSGTVTFTDDATVLGTGTIDAEGLASVTTSALTTVAVHNIAATYNGDANYNGSVSKTLLESLSATGVIVELSSSANPSPRGVPLTFTAKITAIGAVQTPTGSIAFDADGNDLGTFTIDPGTLTASVTVSNLTGGTHFISAVYSGDAVFTAGTTGQLIQRMTAAATTTTVTSSQNPTKFGESITFTATIASPIAGTFTGSVIFRDGNSVLGVGNVSGTTATFTTTALPVGDHSVTAAYSGDANYAPSASPPITQGVESKPEPTDEDAGTTTDAGTGSDAGTGTPADSGTSKPGLGQFDAGIPPGINIGGSDDGCGCRTVGGGAGGTGALVFGLAGLALALVRRKRR